MLLVKTIIARIHLDIIYETIKSIENPIYVNRNKYILDILRNFKLVIIRITY